MKVAIIGAGIGGLTAGIALRRGGIDVAVYEQARELREVGAGVGLWPNALRALEPLGLAAGVLELAGGTIGTGLKRPDGRWILRQPKEVVEKRWGSGLVAVHRAELQSLLASSLGSDAIHLDCRCTGFTAIDPGVIVHFENGRDVGVDALVGADGIHSIVREQLFGPSPPRYRGYVAWRGATPASSVPFGGDSIETWGRGARFGLQPTSGERILWYATANSPPDEADDGDVKERLLERFQHWHAPIGQTIESTAADAIVRNDIYDRRPTRTWTRGPVALIGDAIHPMTPDLGQGACQAMVDATTLARCLITGPDVQSALRTYQRCRFANAAITTLYARLFGTVGQWEGAFSCAARDAALKATPMSVQLRQLDLIVGREGAGLRR